MATYIRRVPVEYLPDTLLNSAERSMLSGNEYLDTFTVGTEVLMPEGLFKIISVEKMGPCVIERTYLELDGAREILPISTKICGKDKTDILLAKNGISEFLARISNSNKVRSPASFVQDRLFQFVRAMLDRTDPYLSLADSDEMSVLSSEWCSLHNDGPMLSGRPVDFNQFKNHADSGWSDVPAWEGRSASQFNAGVMLSQLRDLLYGPYMTDERPSLPISKLVDWASPVVPDDYTDALATSPHASDNCRDVLLDRLTRISGLQDEISKKDLTRLLGPTTRAFDDLGSFGKLDGFYKVERFTSEILAITTLVHELPLAEFSFKCGFSKSKNPGIHWESKVLHDPSIDISDKDLVSKLTKIAAQWNSNVTDVAIAKNRDDEMLLIIYAAPNEFKYFIDLTMCSVLSQTLAYN